MINLVNRQQFYFYTLVVLLLPVLFLMCNKEPTITFDKYPYDSFSIKPQKVIEDTTSIHINFDKLSLIAGPSITSLILRVQELEEGNGYLVLDPASSNKLYRLNERLDSLYLIAEQGKGPNEIDNGFLLANTPLGLFLFQQDRVSKYITEKEEIVAEVRIPSGITYVSEYDKERFLIGKEGIGNSNLQLVDREFNLLQEVGGKLEHIDPKLEGVIFSTVMQYHSQLKIYAEIYFSYPYVALYNEHLNIQKIIELSPYSLFSIVEDKFNPGRYIKTTKAKGQSSSFNFMMPISNAGFFIGIRHSSQKREQHYEYEDVITNVWYSYFLIDKELNIHALGNSPNVLFPAKTGELIMFKDNYLYKTNTYLSDINPSIFDFE